MSDSSPHDVQSINTINVNKQYAVASSEENVVSPSAQHASGQRVCTSMVEEVVTHAERNRGRISSEDMAQVSAQGETQRTDRSPEFAPIVLPEGSCSSHRYENPPSSMTDSLHSHAAQYGSSDGLPISAQIIGGEDTSIRQPSRAEPPGKSSSSISFLPSRMSGAVAATSETIPELSGWAAVEDRTYKYDVGTMKNNSDDVDTLLVFAGLFSAVLTAFVVQSYQLLQPDDSGLSVQLLMRISAQMGSFTVSGPSANSTIPPFPATASSSPTTAARQINIMWFLSLVLSLAASLSGIHAKQWIREYLQWNSILSSPQENVMIRQLRFDAWHRWKVPATLAMIPAMLELAVVFFLIGIVILLWTLDTVVAVVITVAAAIFLLYESISIVLPAFTRHSPYKSPPGWAFAKLWDSFFNRNLFAQSGQMQRHIEPSSQLSGSSPSHGWRVRELVVDSYQDMHAVKKVLPKSPPNTMPPNEPVIETIPGGPLHVSTANIAKVQALAWTQRAFQDVKIKSQMGTCLDSIPGLTLSNSLSSVLGNPYLTFSHILLTFAPALHQRYPATDIPRWIVLARQLYSLQVLSNGYHAVVMTNSGLRLTESDLDTLSSICTSTSIFLDVSSRLLKTLWSQVTYYSHCEPGAFRNMMDILFFTEVLSPSRHDPMGDEFLSQRRAFLLDVCQRPSVQISISTGQGLVHCAGYRTAALLLLCQSACVYVTTDGDIAVNTHRTWMNAEHYASLAAYFYNQAVSTSAPNDEVKHTFVMLADRALQRGSTIHNGACYEQLLNLMTDTARRALSDPTYDNCGCITDLPWIRTLANLFTGLPVVLQDERSGSGLPARGQELRDQLVSLVDVLGALAGMGRLRGAENQQILQTLSSAMSQDDNWSLPVPVEDGFPYPARVRWHCPSPARSKSEDSL